MPCYELGPLVLSAELGTRILISGQQGNARTYDVVCCMEADDQGAVCGKTVLRQASPAPGILSGSKTKQEK